jgi:WD40 repeat protein
MSFSSAALAAVLLLAEPAPPIVALAVTPDASRCCAGSQAGVQIFSLPDLQPCGAIATKLEQVHELVFAPRGEALAIAGGSPGERGAIEIWNWAAATLYLTQSAGNDVAYDVAWRPGGLQLAIAGADKSVTLGYTPKNFRPSATRLMPHSAAVLAVLWLPGDDVVLSAGVDQTIRLIDPGRGQTVRSFENHTGAVRDLALRPGDQEGPQLVASASADRTVRFWQPTIGRLVRFARLPSAPTAICWTPSGSHVLAACEDGRLRAVDPTTVAVIELAPALVGWAYAVAALPDGKSAVLAGERGQLRLVPLDAIVGNALRGVP